MAGMPLRQYAEPMSLNKSRLGYPHILETRKGGPKCPFNNSGYLLNFVINAVTVAAREQLAADPLRAAVLH